MVCIINPGNFWRKNNKIHPTKLKKILAIKTIQEETNSVERKIMLILCFQLCDLFRVVKSLHFKPFKKPRGGGLGWQTNRLWSRKSRYTYINITLNEKAHYSVQLGISMASRQTFQLITSHANLKFCSEVDRIVRSNANRVISQIDSSTITSKSHC